MALVAGWEAGYFFLEGFSPQDKAHEQGPGAELEALFARHEDAAAEAASFETPSALEERERVVASIVRRRGQPEFRKALLGVYRGRCAFSGCDAEDALEAAHIMPYQGPHSNRPSNGLLLRADLHTLFDLGLLTVDTSSMVVLVAARLANTSYKELAGKRITVPDDPSVRPNMVALDKHRQWTGL